MQTSRAFDLIIRGGCVVDGTGREPFIADVGIAGDAIVAVGTLHEAGREEIDGTGLLVTPGFVDIHTHYDGQVAWDERTQPSAAHGVTTVVMGNCGVGFAPCRPQDRERLVRLMEGVEDVPEVVMTDGLPWTWESFPQYLDVIGSRKRDIDVAAQLPHSCLRVYVMGERGVQREPATPEDLEQMAMIAQEAMQAGAIGFATSRTLFHRDRDGVPIPTMDAAEAELQAIAGGMRAAGHGVIEAVFDFGRLDEEFAMLARVAGRSGLPVTFSLAQTLGDPTAWKRALDLMRDANLAGQRIKAQVIARPTGMLLGLNLSYTPLSLKPSFREIVDLPLAQKVAALRDPQRRARILAEASEETGYELLKMLQRFDFMFPLGNPPNYGPTPEMSIAAQAARLGVSPAEIAYDTMLKDGGTALLFLPFANYVDGNLDAALAMVRDENTLLGLADGGAHYGLICDAGYPTFMLQYWGRDCPARDRLSVVEIVKALSADNADAMALRDRGRVAPGYKADLNIIDHAALKLHVPEVAFDLPAGGRRLLQRAEGYVATIVSGKITYRNGVPTGYLPGRLVRGPQQSSLAA
jgi:N-acyl-D-aspartate/D-glutamate deacylase